MWKYDGKNFKVLLWMSVMVHTITYFNLLLSLAGAINQSKQANVSRLYDRIPVYFVDKHVSLLCKRAHILSYTDKTPALIDLYFLSVFLFFSILRLFPILQIIFLYYLLIHLALETYLCFFFLC